MTQEIITRNDAHAAGLRRFFTGRPCAHGHTAERFVSTGGCVACNAARSKAFGAQAKKADGKFVYPLAHPDDHAAAWAYCQALDLARGAVPAQRPDDAAPPMRQATPDDVVAARVAAFKGFDVPPVQSTTLAPAMADQLRALGVIK